MGQNEDVFWRSTNRVVNYEEGNRKVVRGLYTLCLLPPLDGTTRMPNPANHTLVITIITTTLEHRRSSSQTNNLSTLALAFQSLLSSNSP
jgi:hypothetical protein